MSTMEMRRKRNLPMWIWVNEILKCFDCKVNVLNVGEPKDGKYTINVCFVVKKNQYKLPEGFIITTNIEIFEEDYKKWCMEVKEKE